jgi:hypothetical protein
MNPPEGEEMRKMIDEWVVKETGESSRSKRQAAIL